MKYVTFITPNPDKKYIECINNNKDLLGDRYTVHEYTFEGNGTDAATKKDELAYQYIMNTDDVIMVVDADIILLETLDEYEGQNAFIIFHSIPDTSLFTCSPDYVRGIYTDKDRRGILDVYGWSRKVLRNRSVVKIPESKYIHYMITYKTQKQSYIQL